MGKKCLTHVGTEGSSVPFIEHTLTKTLAGLSAPSGLTATKIPNGIRLAWTDNVPAGDRIKLSSYKIYHDINTGTTKADYPNTIPDIPIDSASYDYFPGDDVAHFFRVVNVDKTAQETALSNEANSVRGEFGDPETLDARKPAAPIAAIRGDGGSPGNYIFFISIAPADAIGRSAIRKVQFQIRHESDGGSTGWTSGGGFPSVSKYADGTNADEVLDNFQHYQLNRSFFSFSNDVGPYYLTARLFNDAGDVWSDWSSPVNAVTVAGTPDTVVAGTANVSLKLADVSSAAGGALHFFIEGPTDGGFKTIYGVEIQCWTTLWAETNEHTLDLVNPGAEHTGDITLGPDAATGKKTIKSISPVLVASAEVNKIAYLYDSFNVNGEIVNQHSGKIQANTTTEIDVFQRAGSTTGWTETVTGKKFRIADDWHSRLGTYDFAQFYSAITPNPNAQAQINTTGQTFITPLVPIPVSGSIYFRFRFWNRFGSSKWIYWDGTTATTTRASAVTFPVKQIQTAAIKDGAVIGVKQAKGVMPAAADVKVIPKAGDVQDSASWAAATMYWGDGTSETINAGSADNLTVGNQYWLYKIAGNAVLATTTSPPSAFADDRFPVAILTPTAVANEQIGIASFFSVSNNISADMLGVGKVAAVTADLGAMTAGSVTTSLLRTGSGPQKIQLDGTGGVHKFEVIDSGGFIRLDIATTLDSINFYNLTGAKVGAIGGLAGGGMRIEPATALNGTFTAATFGNMFFQANRDGTAGQGEIEIELGDGVPILNTVTFRTTETTFTLGGTAPALSASTVATFQNNAAVGDNAIVSIIAGSSGNSILAFGDSGDEDRAVLRYLQGTDVFEFQLAGFAGEIPLTLSTTEVNISDDILTFKVKSLRTEFGAAPSAPGGQTVSIKTTIASDAALVCQAHVSQSTLMALFSSSTNVAWLSVTSDGSVTVGSSGGLGKGSLQVEQEMSANQVIAGTSAVMSIGGNLVTHQTLLIQRASSNSHYLKFTTQNTIIDIDSGEVGSGTVRDIRFRFAGTTSVTFYKDRGVVIGAATGGSKGAGTLNVDAGIYDDGVLNTDYILQPGWGVMPLEKAIKFVAENEHLPTIDGADHWDRHGKPSLGHRQNQLNAAIESNFLYIEDVFYNQERLQKEIADLRRSLAELTKNNDN